MRAKHGIIQTVTKARVFLLGGGGDGDQETGNPGLRWWRLAEFCSSKLFAPGARHVQLQNETTDLHLHQLN